MGDDRDLETPKRSEDLYLAYGAEVSDFKTRPAFTGDVYKVSPDRLVALIQHPCAMRRGVELAPRLVTSQVLWGGGVFP